MSETTTAEKSTDVVELQPIAAPTPQPPVVRTAPTPFVAGNRVRPIVPTSLAEVAKLAAVISESGLAPYGMKTVQQVAVAIMYGAEIGLPPMQALQSIAVINGRPTIYGDAGVALIRDSGLLTGFKEWIDGEGDAMTAHCEVERAGVEKIERTFSVADAKVAKLWGKKGRDGGDTPWITYPKRMMTFRARWWAFRDLFADILRGFQFAEEVQDYPPVEAEVETQSITARLPGPKAVEGEGFDHERIGEEVASTGNGGLDAAVEHAVGKEGDDGFTDDERKMIADATAALEECGTQKEIDVLAGEYANSIATMSEKMAAAMYTAIKARREALAAAPKKKPAKKEHVSETLV